MAKKGLAVISGSSTVIFKALEDGTVKMGGHAGSVLTSANIDITGSLLLKSETDLDLNDGFKLELDTEKFKLQNLTGNGDAVIISGASDLVAKGLDGSVLPKQRSDADAAVTGSIRNQDLQLRGGLVWAATSSIHPDMKEDPSEPGYFGAIDTLDNTYELPEDFVTITSDGELRRVNKIDASAVVLNDGKNVEQKIGVLSLEVKLSQSTDIDVYSVDQKNVNLGRGTLNFKDVEHRTHVTTADVDDGNGVEVTINLDPELRVETLSASMGLEVTGSSKLRGDLHVVKDEGAGLTGDATVDGHMTIKGNLNVWGDTTVTTAESKHLVIEDALIRLGTDHSASQDGVSGVDIDSVQTEFGFLFGDVNTRALVLDSGDLYFGLTGSVAAGNEVTPDYESAAAKNLKLYVPNLSASANISGLSLNIGLGGAKIVGDLEVTGSTVLGTDDADEVVIKSTLTASADALFQDHVTIQGDNKANLTISNGDVSVVGSGSFTGDFNVDGTGSFGKSVTLRTGADLTLEQGNAKVNGVLTVTGSSHISSSSGTGENTLRVTGETVLSSSLAEGRFALDVESGHVTIRDNFTVEEGIVTLGNTAAAAALNRAGEWSQAASLNVKGSMNVSGSVLLGHLDSATNSDNHAKVIVNGEFRIPVYTASQVPAAFKANEPQADHVGFMFYLKGEGIPDSHFAQGNKWYFNENGYWHSSFFWTEV